MNEALPINTATATESGDGNSESSGKVKYKSLKSRPGAGKRKEQLVAMERERFARNMAIMASANIGDGTVARIADGKGSKERWAAIREFIGQTMETRRDGDG